MLIELKEKNYEYRICINIDTVGYIDYFITNIYLWFSFVFVTGRETTYGNSTRCVICAGSQSLGTHIHGLTSPLRVGTNNSLGKELSSPHSMCALSGLDIGQSNLSRNTLQKEWYL